MTGEEGTGRDRPDVDPTDSGRAGRPTAAWLIERFGLVPLEAEGGRFRQLWRSQRHWPGNDKPAGTAIVFLLTTAPGDFSTLHRLPTDEVWHRYLGDPSVLLLLHPDGRSETVVLGEDLAAGQQVFAIVPAGTWMGCFVPAGGHDGWALLGCTLAPGFTVEDYEGGDRDDLVARHPDRAELIDALSRPGEPTRMTPTDPTAGHRDLSAG